MSNPQDPALTYRKHQAIAAVFLVAIVVTGADWFFQLGIFGKYAKGTALLVALCFTFWMSRYGPTVAEVQVARDIKDRRLWLKCYRERLQELHPTYDDVMLNELITIEAHEALSHDFPYDPESAANATE